MGEVHRATQLSLQRTVAVKLLSQLAGEPGAVPALQRESRLMAALNHPHVVIIYDCGQIHDRHYLVMEYVDGSTLRTRLEPGKPMPVEQAAPILDATARALAHIHEQGILHLDLKPENVLCTTTGSIKITDFGLASPQAGRSLTEPWQCWGTVDYCAPEQRHGLRLDRRSDVFALATLAYELLTGHLPSRVYVPASERNPLLPRAVNDVLARGLARDPDERYGTVEELRRGLERALGLSKRRSRWGSILIAALVGIEIVLFVAWWTGGVASRRDEVVTALPVEASFLRPTTFPGRDKLLYPSNRVGNSNIYVLHPDGSAPVPLTHDEGRSLFPACSADGKKIAFVSDRGGGLDIYVMDADGRNVKQLTKDSGANRAPSWSPDGKRITFASDRAGSFQIYVMAADGARQVPLTRNTVFSGDPAWSPDGTKIAFTSRRNEQKGLRLFVMNPDGTNLRTLTTTDNSFGFVYPAWSPDSKHIAFGESAGSAIEIFICSVDGSSLRQLTRLGGANSMAAWSRDGAWIVFHHTSANEEHGTLYVVASDGRNPRVVLKAAGPTDGGRPAWKPQ
jgi:hypothetical protein